MRQTARLSYSKAETSSPAYLLHNRNFTWIGTYETATQSPFGFLVAQRSEHAFHANAEE